MRSRSNHLTQLQVDVLEHMADGDSNAEIAAELYRGHETIRTHVKLILAKLRARNRAHAVAIGYETGLLKRTLHQ